MGKVNPMDALKAALAERKAKAQKTISDQGGQKWIKGSVLEQKRKDEYYENLEKEKEKEAAEDEARVALFDAHLTKRESKNPILNQDAKKSDILEDALLEDDDAEPPLSLSEVVERLREMGDPITLFGETDMQRYKRLRLMEKEAHEGKKNPDILMLEGTHTGQQTAMQDELERKEDEKAAEEEDDDDDDDDEDGADEDAPVEEKSDSEDEGDAGMVDDKGDSEDETAEQAATKPAEVALEPEIEEPTFDLETMDKCDFIRSWVRKTMKAFEKELADKSDEDKKTAQAKKEVQAHRQVRRDVRPLLKRLRIYRIEDFMLVKLHPIIELAENRDYQKASEAYLDLSIGKAAWPVGIGCGGTMLMEDAIGLHDKFNNMPSVKDIAWALNDEPTRKYVQALKRLMTVAQKHWPPSDPSKGYVV